MVSAVHCQLWMGSLEPYMTETFILNAFRKMGENPLSVKVMRNKFTGEPAGYAFVHFSSDQEAIDAMLKLNFKPIPGVASMVRFKLNNASNNAGRALMDGEFSVWVGDLSPDVDDYSLYRVFASKYKTIKTAKVILVNSGFSKGFGFVRFGSEEEMKDSLITMNGYRGLGTKPLKISNAVPRLKGAATPGNPTPGTPTPGTPTPATATNTQSSGTDFSQYYDPSTTWQNYPSWQTQGQQAYYDQSGHQTSHNSALPENSQKTTNEEDLKLIEHTVPLDFDKMNREKIESDCNLWDALESSKWMPVDMAEVA